MNIERTIRIVKKYHKTAIRLIINEQTNNTFIKLCEILKSCRSIKKINLECTRGKHIHIKAFCDMVKINKTIVALEIECKKHNLGEILSMIEDSKSLTHLNLKISTLIANYYDGIERLFNVLEKNKTIIACKIVLIDYIKKIDETVLANLIKNNKVLKYFLLNDLCDNIKNYVPIINALRDNNTLEYIWISNIKITDSTYHHIKDMFQNNRTLKKIKLWLRDHNNTEKIIDLFNLTNCKIHLYITNRKNKIKLFELLSTNSNIVYLHFLTKSNNIPELTEALKYNRTLRKISISNLTTKDINSFINTTPNNKVEILCSFCRPKGKIDTVKYEQNKDLIINIFKYIQNGKAIPNQYTKMMEITRQRLRKKIRLLIKMCLKYISSKQPQWNSKIEKYLNRDLQKKLTMFQTKIDNRYIFHPTEMFYKQT